MKEEEVMKGEEGRRKEPNKILKIMPLKSFPF
jgi:hypothetical protein